MEKTKKSDVVSSELKTRKDTSDLVTHGVLASDPSKVASSLQSRAKDLSSAQRRDVVKKGVSEKHTTDDLEKWNEKCSTIITK